MAIAWRWYVTVLMGDTRNQEPTNPDDFGNVAGRDDGLLPMQTGVSATGAGRDLRESMPTVQSLPLLHLCTCRGPRPGKLRAGARALILVFALERAGAEDDLGRAVGPELGGVHFLALDGTSLPCQENWGPDSWLGSRPI